MARPALWQAGVSLVEETPEAEKRLEGRGGESVGIGAFFQM